MPNFAKSLMLHYTFNYRWNEIVRFNRYEATAQTIAELSNGYVLPGKWDIHGDLDELHVLWDKMCRALYEGKTFPSTCPGAIYMEKRMRVSTHFTYYFCYTAKYLQY
jgi:hypothetical protein